MLWITKYKPNGLDEIVGNSIAIKKTIEWAKDVTYKPLIISGPPGVGKTTTAHALLKYNNNYIIEFDINNLKSKNKIQQKFSKLINTRSIEYLFKRNSKTVSILIDNVKCPNDKSAIKDIIRFLKDKYKKSNSIIPVIIVCDNHGKLGDIKKIATNIRFKYPTRIDLFNHAKKIIQNEKMMIDDMVLNFIVKHAQLDFRRLVNILYYISIKQTETEITTNNILKLLENFSIKDQDNDIYDISSKILNNYCGISDTLKLCETDRSLSTLMIHENYIDTVIYNRKGSNKEKIDVICKISDSLSHGDIFDMEVSVNKIGWNLGTHLLFLNNVLPSYYLNKTITKYSYNKVNTIRFTKLLSNTSQSYTNYKLIYGNFLNEFGEYNNIVVDILLDNIFSKEGNIMLPFEMLKKHNLELDYIDKLISYNKKYKKLYTKKKKNKLAKEYKAWLENLEDVGDNI